MGARALQTTDDRQTDGRATANSEREREFTFAKTSFSSICTRVGYFGLSCLAFSALRDGSTFSSFAFSKAAFLTVLQFDVRHLQLPLTLYSYVLYTVSSKNSGILFFGHGYGTSERPSTWPR